LSLGASLFLLAVGAILTFAVEVTAEGFNINTVGIILMVVGGIGLLLSLMWMQRSRSTGSPTVVREEEPRGERVVREERRDVL
jgi:membrane-bound ClpP family serine protease